MADDPVRVFVSHHHSPDEDAFTTRLVSDLEATGADVRVDMIGVPPDRFLNSITSGLDGPQWLVLVMTPAALTSPWIQREVTAALNEYPAGRMLGVQLLVVQPCREQDMPPAWRTLHRIDATRDYQGALTQLLQVLELPAPARQPPSPVPTPWTWPMPTDRFPPRLASLGYQAKIVSGVEVILPPLCEVPAGAFLMGSDPTYDRQADKYEMSQHAVTLAAYQIGAYPVTVAEYACFVHCGHREPGSRSLFWRAQHTRLEHPVVNVSWHDAIAYAAWLTKLTDRPWRVPTEAEWEKAARWEPDAGTARLYPWGDEFTLGKANTRERWRKKRGTTMPVGSFPAGVSPCGAFDMAGNVWEWTSSHPTSYPDDASDGRELTAASNDRILRGGSWSDPAVFARAAWRQVSYSGYLYLNTGFRVMRAGPAS
jgi:formylglycine-generating enzyme required for sulfatase activity